MCAQWNAIQHEKGRGSDTFLKLEVVMLSEVSQTNTVASPLWVESEKKLEFKDLPGGPVAKNLP